MKNVDIYVNGERAVYDERTKIGSILRNFDITDLENRRLIYTNSMHFPIDENQHIFDFADSAGYSGTMPYDKVSVEIFVDGYRLVEDGIGYIQSVSEGYIVVNVRNQPDVIQTMKDRKLSELDGRVGPIAIPWAQTLLNATSGPKIDIIYNDQSEAYTIANPTRYRSYRYYSNLTYYVHSIFTIMGTTDSITFNGSLMTDTEFTNMRLIASQIGMHRPTGGVTLFADDVIFNSEKTFYDLFKAVMQMFCAVYTIDGSTITIEKYDDVIFTEQDWSSKSVKELDKRFTIENIAQNNYMRYIAAEGADERQNESLWVCNNKNIQNDTVLIEPDITSYPDLNLVGLMTGVAPGTVAIEIPDSEYDIVTNVGGTTQTIVKAISDFVFVVDGTLEIPTGTIIDLEYTLQNSAATQLDSHTTVGGDNKTIAEAFSSQNQYQRFETMIDTPVVYDVEIDLNVLDLHDFEPFKLVNIPDLGGRFHVNKLQYNFEKQGRASRATLIKYTGT